METYIYNDQIYTREDLEGVAQRKGYTFEELLQKNPSIKPADLGNQPGVANGTATVTPLQRAVAGGYRPVGISLDLQNVAPLKSRAELEEEEEIRQARINAVLNISPPGLPKLPASVKRKAFNFIGGSSELIRGIPEYIDAKARTELGATGGIPTNFMTYNIQAANIVKRLIRGDTEEQVSEEGLVDTSGWRAFNEKLLSLNKRYYNDDGTEADFQELAAQGRTEEASEKLVSEAFVALPSLAVSIFGGPYGIAALGVSAAGSSFERTMRENPDESLSKAFFISNMQGGIEAGSEWAGGKFLKNLAKLGKLASAGKFTGKGINKKIVDDLIRKTSDKFLTRAGFKVERVAIKTGKVLSGAGFEGATEGLANVFNETIQEVAYSGKAWSAIDHGRIWTKAINEFAVGAVLGGGTSIVTQNLNPSGITEQNVAMHIAPNHFKQQVYNLEKEKLSLVSKAEKAATKKEKTKFEKQIKKKTKEISDKKAQVVEAFNGLTDVEKRSYAQTLDNLQSNYDLLYEEGTKYTEEQQKGIWKSIREDYRKLDDILAYDKLGIDANTEARFTRVLKNTLKIESTIRNKRIAGLKVEILDTDAKIKAAAKKHKGFDPGADGMFIAKATKGKEATILINPTVAAFTGQTNVLGHEKGHFLLSKFFKTDNASLAPLVESFKEYLKESGNANILKRIDQRFKENNYIDEDGNYKKGTLEEYFNMFSDIVANEKIELVETKGIGNKLAKTYTNVMQGLGLATVQFNTGKDVFDFIRNYTKNIQKSDKILGVKLESTVVPGVGEKAKLPLSETQKSKLSKTQKDVTYYNDLSIEDMLKQHDYTYHYSDARGAFEGGRRQEEIINNKIKELGGWTQNLVNTWNKHAPENMKMNFDDLTIEERGGPLTDKDKKTRLAEARRISGTKFSKSTGKDIDAAYTEGKSPFEIAIMFEPLVTKIANQRYKTAPDFNTFKEDLIQSSLLEKGGVIDLINSYKEGTGTLSGYINQTIRVDKKTGEKISLLKSRMDGIASKLFGEKFTEDVTERVDIAAPEAAPVEITTTETPQTRNVIDRLNLSPSLANVGKTAITKGLATVGAVIPLNKGFTFRENLKKNVRNSMYEAVKKELGGNDISEYTSWVEQNAEEIYNIIPLGDLVKNKPLTDKFTTRPVDKQGRQLRKGETFSGRKTYAGNLVFEKKPWSPQVKKDFIAEFTKGRNAKETRRLFLTNTIAKEIAFDQALEVIKDPVVLEKIAVTQSQEVMNNFTEELSRQVERGQFVKYSKSKALDNWIVDSTKEGGTSIIGEINNGIYDVLKAMQPTGKYRYNEDMDFGTAFVKHFNPPKKYANEIENDLNKLWRKTVGETTGTFSLKGASKGVLRPLKLGVFVNADSQDKGYDYVMFRLTGDPLGAKVWNTKAGEKKITNEYHGTFIDFASKHLTLADIKTDALTQNVYINLVDRTIRGPKGKKDKREESIFLNNLDNFLGVEKGKRGEALIDGVKRGRAKLSTFTKGQYMNRISPVYDGDFSNVDAHNKYADETIRPQYRRILNSLYDYVQDGMGTSTENARIKFATRFATMMFRGGNTWAPFRESAIITHVGKDIKTPYAEHAKQIETLGEDFMVGQEGDNFLAAFILGGAKGKKVLNKAIDKMFATNGVFIIDETQATGPQGIDKIHGRVGLPNKNFITSRLQGVVSESEIIPIESGIVLTEGDTYNLNKGLNSDVFEAKAIDQNNNELFVKFSKTRSKPSTLADMIDRKSDAAKDIKSAKDLAAAARAGEKAENKFFYGNNWNMFLPYSAEDFYGLIQKMAGKGKQGDMDLKFLKENLLDTYSQGISDLETDRRSMFKSYRELKKQIKDSPFKLRTRLTEKGLENFTLEDAIRVYVWQQSKHEIPGLTVTKANKMAEIVANDKALRSFAFGLMTAMKTDGYPKPHKNWISGRIGTDFSQSLNDIKRAKYLKKWQTNVDLLFNDKNKAKLTAAFGASYVKNLENTLQRMKSGTNRKPTNSDAANLTQDFINGSVGTIMFFNMRSATLQSISAINYMNWSDNNPLMIAKALSNPKQFAKDFIYLMNSDYLTNRRQGLKINVQEAEIADAAKSKNPVRAIIGHMLKIGFLPTQIIDSVAIASGGSSLYRNRINSYIKKGMSKEKAEAAAYQDWRQLSNEAQQSSDPSRISNLQASNFGRLIFAFANTPMQYTRLTKRALSDLVNKRGDTKTNVSKIVYYMAVQNIIFNTMQSALFAVDFDEEDEYKGRKLSRKAKALRREFKDKKVERIVNGMSDSVLRGLGFGGAMVSMLKNAGMSYYKEQQKENEFFKDWANVLLSITDISPPVDHKVRKVKAIIEAGKYDSNISPSLEAAINALSFLNVPADRVQKKLENIQGAMDRDLDNWQRIAQFLGWADWELGIEGN